jgi:predicted transcriptional regulator
MKRRKPGRALERITLEIHESDEFLEHVGSIAELYRREHALDATPRGPALRQSLKHFSKHATALTQWLEQAHKGRGGTAEHDALDKLGSALYGAAHRAHTASVPVAEWLAQATAAAERCLSDVALLPKQPQRNAPVIAAEALRSTFEHHKLKLSTQASPKQQSDAVRLLCAIAKNSGDSELTPADARQALLQSGKKLARASKMSG